MKKIIKYLLPFAFIAFSLFYLIASLIIINVVFSGDMSALLFLFISVILLLAIITPVYCAYYSRIIQGERLKVLFAFYNTLILAFPCVPLALLVPDARGYCMAFLVWVLFWSLLFPIPKTKSADNQELPTSNSTTPHFLLQSTIKNIIAICFTIFYMISLAKGSLVWQMYRISDFLMFTLPLFSAFVILLFLISKRFNFELKKWLLPLALACELINRIILNFYGLLTIKMQIKYNAMYPVTFIFSCIATILIAVMLIGTLFDYKYIKLFRYGTLAYIILSVGLFIFNLINGNFYHQIDANGTLAINPVRVTESLLQMLYFVGIFLLSTNKRNTPATACEKIEEDIN